MPQYSVVYKAMAYKEARNSDVPCTWTQGREGHHASLIWKPDQGCKIDVYNVIISISNLNTVIDLVK